jgi:hypothetical protein
MKLSELAKEPTLIKLTIDKEELVEKYGDELEFFMYDRQSIDVFSKLAEVNEDNIGGYMHILQDIILNEKGHPVITDTEILPMDVLTEAMRLIGERLGK